MTPPFDLPVPPIEMRKLVGPTDLDAFDNSTGGPVFPGLPPGSLRAVLDFGCGCGRIARQLIQQTTPPERYVGIDLHAGMIRWCQENLTPRAPQFRFEHHDVRYEPFNPGAGKPVVLPFPVADSSCSLVIAHSVFTHLLEEQTVFYLREVARVLAPDGILCSTWFLFDKSEYPMMQEFQNTLFINAVDPINAVIYDRTWLRQMTRAVGLTLLRVSPPTLRGFQWEILMTNRGWNSIDAEIPPDEGDIGLARAAAHVVDPD